MNVLERIVIGAGIIVVGTTLVYRYVLSDDQRTAIREASETIANSAHDVSDSVSTLRPTGRTHAEEKAAIEASRVRTSAQWEALGY